MKQAYFDCQFGAAGDMLLSALLHAGLSQEKWLKEVGKIALPAGSYKLSITDTNRGGIAAKKLDVTCEDTAPSRSLADIEEIIDKSAIDAKTKTLSRRIFGRLADAEAEVHGVTAGEVHFHEVGAIDAIIDIVGFSIAFNLLAIEKAVVSPMALGTGVTQMAHGAFPVPAPAVVSLIKSAAAPVRASQIDFECLTPTGAAILTTIADVFGCQPAFNTITGIGYGAGTNDPPAWPNVTRVILGDCVSETAGRFDAESVFVLEANLDDFSPQSLSFAMDRLFTAGALDVTVCAAVMKKGRSGHILSVLCKPEDQQKIQELILLETTTIGVRSYPVERVVARREWQNVQLQSGEVRVKIARDRAGKLINAQPEFDDCAEYAMANNVPLKEVLAQALAKLQQMI